MVSSLKRSSAQKTVKAANPLSTLAFDWVYTLLVFLVTAGIYMDGWSHSSFGPDQSVFSEYHLLFYTSLAAIGMWLFGTAYLNRRDGYVGLKALPAGYKISALGLIIFGITGVFDLGGHAMFGFEVDNEALYSPTHIGLFIGWALIAIGPLRAALQRQRLEGTNKLSFLQFLPALLAWIFFFNVLAFISMNTFITANPWMLMDMRTSNSYFGETLGIMGIIIQTAMTVGALAYLTLNFRLPLGTFTIFFVLFALFGGVNDLSLDLLPFLVIVGILLDVLYRFLRPSFNRQVSFHSFNVLIALVLWGTFYAFVFATNYGDGVWYTPYTWTGTITQSMVTALLISLAMTSAPKRLPAAN